MALILLQGSFLFLYLNPNIPLLRCPSHSHKKNMKEQEVGNETRWQLTLMSNKACLETSRNTNDHDFNACWLQCQGDSGAVTWLLNYLQYWAREPGQCSDVQFIAACAGPWTSLLLDQQYLGTLIIGQAALFIKSLVYRDQNSPLAKHPNNNQRRGKKKKKTYRIGKPPPTIWKKKIMIGKMKTWLRESWHNPSAFQWQSGKEFTCQHRRCKRQGLDPWVGKIPWRRKWQPTSAFLSGKTHGQSSPVGYSLWSQSRTWQSKRARMDTEHNPHGIRSSNSCFFVWAYVQNKHKLDPRSLKDQRI